MTFSHITYEELVKDYIRHYILEYGRRKFEKVNKKVQTSKKISTLIYNSKQQLIAPNKNDFLYCLHEIPFFLVSNAETVALGALLGLERWNQECNQNLDIIESHDLKNIAFRILEDCKKLKVNY